MLDTVIVHHRGRNPLRIQCAGGVELTAGESEARALAAIKTIAGKNLLFRNHIGQRLALIGQYKAHLAPVSFRALANQKIFLFQAIEHSRHRAAVQGQVAAQLGRGIDRVLSHDDQHLELRGGDAVRLHVRVDDAIFKQRCTAQ